MADWFGSLAPGKFRSQLYAGNKQERVTHALTAADSQILGNEKCAKD